MYERIALECGQMSGRIPEDRRAVGDDRGSAEIVADKSYDATQAGFTRRPYQRVHVARGTRARIDCGGKAAAQAFERRQLRRKIDHPFIQAAFERHPYTAKDFGRLAEDERLSQGLGQMGMGVDEAWHHKMMRQLYRPQVGVPAADKSCGTDFREAPLADHYPDSGSRTFRQEGLAGVKQEITVAQKPVAQIRHFCIPLNFGLDAGGGLLSRAGGHVLEESVDDHGRDRAGGKAIGEDHLAPLRKLAVDARNKDRQQAHG